MLETRTCIHREGVVNVSEDSISMNTIRIREYLNSFSFELGGDASVQQLTDGLCGCIMLVRVAIVGRSPDLGGWVER